MALRGGGSGSGDLQLVLICCCPPAAACSSPHHPPCYLQLRNNARVAVAGSIDMFSDAAFAAEATDRQNKK